MLRIARGSLHACVLLAFTRGHQGVRFPCGPPIVCHFDSNWSSAHQNSLISQHISWFSPRVRPSRAHSRSSNRSPCALSHFMARSTVVCLSHHHLMLHARAARVSSLLTQARPTHDRVLLRALWRRRRAPRAHARGCGALGRAGLPALAAPLCRRNGRQFIIVPMLIFLHPSFVASFVELQMMWPIPMS